MDIGHADNLTLEPRRAVEIDPVAVEERETDDLVRSEVAQLINRIKAYGRTVYGVRGPKGEVRGRYDELIAMINESVHDTIGNGE